MSASLVFIIVLEKMGAADFCGAVAVFIQNAVLDAEAFEIVPLWQNITYPA